MWIIATVVSAAVVVFESGVVKKAPDSQWTLILNQGSAGFQNVAPPESQQRRQIRQVIRSDAAPRNRARRARNRGTLNSRALCKCN